jgi:hypothetical protein
MKPVRGKRAVFQDFFCDAFERAVESFLHSRRYLLKTVQAGEVRARFENLPNNLGREFFEGIHLRD